MSPPRCPISDPPSLCILDNKALIEKVPLKLLICIPCRRIMHVDGTTIPMILLQMPTHMLHALFPRRSALEGSLAEEAARLLWWAAQVEVTASLVFGDVIFGDGVLFF